MKRDMKIKTNMVMKMMIHRVTPGIDFKSRGEMTGSKMMIHRVMTGIVTRTRTITITRAEVTRTGFGTATTIRLWVTNHLRPFETPLDRRRLCLPPSPQVHTNTTNAINSAELTTPHQHQTSLTSYAYSLHQMMIHQMATWCLASKLRS